MKKVLSVILAAVLAASTVAFADENMVVSDWAKEEAAEAASLGIIPEGFAVTDYTRPITREHFCDLAVGMLEAREFVLNGEDAETETEIIRDTFNVNVKKLFNAGIVQGKHHTKSGVAFAPNDFITREEAAAILLRMSSFMKVDVPEVVDIPYYDDEDAISDYAADAVNILRQMEIMKGTADNLFSPKDTYTAEQSAATLVRLYHRPIVTVKSVMTLLIPDNITEIAYSAIEDPLPAFEPVSDTVRQELLSSFTNIVAVEGLVKDVEPSGHAFLLTADGEQTALYLHSNGVVRIISNGEEEQYLLDDMESFAHITRVLNMELYKYETPLGSIKSMTDYRSYVNFAISCSAKIVPVEDMGNFDETRVMSTAAVKAFTDGMGTAHISFSDFAAFFGGEWKLQETPVPQEDGSMKYDYELSFTYDPAKEVALEAYTPQASSDAEWPNKENSVDVLYLLDIDTVTVNGEKREIRSQYGGKMRDGHILMYDGELYIPVQMIADLMGYDSVGLDIIWE